MPDNAFVDYICFFTIVQTNISFIINNETLSGDLLSGLFVEQVGTEISDFLHQTSEHRVPTVFLRHMVLFRQPLDIWK